MDIIIGRQLLFTMVSTMPTSVGNEYDWYGVAPPLQCTQCSKLLGMTFSLRRNSDRYHSTGIPASSIILFADENNLHGLKPLATEVTGYLSGVDVIDDVNGHFSTQHSIWR